MHQFIFFITISPILRYPRKKCLSFLSCFLALCLPFKFSFFSLSPVCLLALSLPVRLSVYAFSLPFRLSVALLVCPCWFGWCFLHCFGLHFPAVYLVAFIYYAYFSDFLNNFGAWFITDFFLTIPDYSWFIFWLLLIRYLFSLIIFTLFLHYRSYS